MFGDLNPKPIKKMEPINHEKKMMFHPKKKKISMKNSINIDIMSSSRKN